MSERHQARADHDGAAVTEHAVGQKPAEYRRQIDEPGIEAVDLRGERLDVERPEGDLERALERREPDHGAGMLGPEQVLHHVEHEQRAHAVIGEALPHLGREQVGERARMAEELGRLGAGQIGGGHGANLA